MIIVGVDPGKTGALAVIENGKLVDVIDMPVTEVTVGGSKRKQIVPTLLADFFRSVRPDLVVLESVNTRPGEGAVGAFTFGRGFGAIEGIVAALQLPSSYVTPVVWKRALRLSADKNVARMTAIRLFPAFAEKFKRVKDDGRAEAALIAYYGSQLQSKGI